MIARVIRGAALARYLLGAIWRKDAASALILFGDFRREVSRK